ncbi:related to Putative glucan 1,3-beta-glucosidase [Phialocephala subalpina]|uniref:Related to Putative glucan 1,3-beta-glucosidase n=1 Tax=Phialocephala subalpina TaxID=576137 RepID=A0A1L7WLX1_9HELO|nr:related to Putative glucan 1,3-beta-glucosidase [Phialocephala subalpina]
MALSRPASDDIFRYRYQHGTNLGSIFVLERWLSGSMYVDGINGDSELDAVNANLNTYGPDATRSKWEAHWNNALSNDDLTWLVNTAHCNMIRLPIGWFTLGPSYCGGSAFDGAPAQVYVNAWAAVRNIVQRCHDAGIGVLIDLHALPGGANSEIHSGTSSGTASLWGNSFNLNLATSCLVFIANEANTMPGVVGLQFCNEAETGAAGKGMFDWYGSTCWQVNQVNKNLPVYISDSWDLRTALPFLKNMNPTNSGALNPMIIDTHRYYTFSDFDKSQSPQQIIASIPNELNELDGQDGNVFNGGAACVLVGEYSCVLDPVIWSKTTPDQFNALKQQFGTVQSQRWQSRSGGSSFWTFKMDWMDGGDWGFKQQTNDGNITAPAAMTLAAADINNRAANANSAAQGLHDAALNAHVNYWNGAAPGQHFEHFRYDSGWWNGWTDAQTFFTARVSGHVPGGNGGDKIGFVDLWVRKRMLETNNEQSSTGFGWEWEQGFRKGLADYYGAVGI